MKEHCHTNFTDGTIAPFYSAILLWGVGTRRLMNNGLLLYIRGKLSVSKFATPHNFFFFFFFEVVLNMFFEKKIKKIKFFAKQNKQYIFKNASTR